jgi:hypothetical protein
MAEFVMKEVSWNIVAIKKCFICVICFLNFILFFSIYIYILALLYNSFNFAQRNLKYII